jgi:hypothetical protein
MVFTDRVGLREECDQCHADVHVCKNCEFYDPKVYNECREPSAEVIREKERSNYCDYFAARAGSVSEQQKKQDLRAAAEALFKKKDS